MKTFAKYRQAFRCYQKILAFRILIFSILFFMMAHSFLTLGGVIDEIVGFLTFCVAGLILPLILGAMLREQFVHSRAALIPHYRSIHLHVTALLYAVYLVVMCLYRSQDAFRMFFEMFDPRFASQDVPLVEFICVWGMVSMGLVWGGFYFDLFYRVMIFGFMAMMLISWVSIFFPQILMPYETWLQISAMAVPVLIFLLVKRLLSLREDFLEFKIVPFFELYKLQRSNGALRGWKGYDPARRARPLFRRSISFRPYPRGQGLWARVRFRMQGQMKSRGFMFFNIWVAYAFFLSRDAIMAGEFEQAIPYLMMPFVMTMGGAGWIVNSNLGGWRNLDRDLLKPCRRKDFILEQCLSDLLVPVFFCLMFFASMVIFSFWLNPTNLFQRRLWSIGMMGISWQFFNWGFLTWLTFIVRTTGAGLGRFQRSGIAFLVTFVSMLLIYFALIAKLDFIWIEILALTLIGTGVFFARRGYKNSLMVELGVI